MMLGHFDIGPFEGLIHSTAARYSAYLDDDIEDIEQVLRVKVWQALRAYDPARVRGQQARTQEEEWERIKRYVFSCVRNRVKDLLKQQYRLNRARGSGRPLYTDDVAAAAPDRFEFRYLVLDEEIVYAVVEDEGVQLPSTLTVFEVKVVHLLLLEMNQTEAARVLGVPRGRVRSAHAAVKAKMADWCPDGLPVNGDGRRSRRPLLDQVLS